MASAIRHDARESDRNPSIGSGLVWSKCQKVTMVEQPNTDPGKLWMLQLQQGDDEALRRIVAHYGRRVVSFFRRFGVDESGAEDLAQEVFLRIFRAKDRYQPTAKFSTWLHRIQYRMAINEGTRNRWRRSIPIRMEGEDSDEDGLPEPRENKDPFDDVRIEETREQVRRAVYALPAKQRVALLLNRFEGLSYEAVGEALGMRTPAVKSLLYRARENVKSKLASLSREEISDEVSRVSKLDY